MSIDTSLFTADIPAGTYAKGDRVQLGVIAGPGVVRSGRGSAILKRITSLMVSTISGATSYWKVHVKNSDWIDDAVSLTTLMSAATALDRRTGCIQSGNNCPLTPNSSWEVWAECFSAGTTTVANTVACLIDVDYPQVSSIIDPDALQGFPTSIEDTSTGVTINAPGTSRSAGWVVKNVDIFKAGYQYALCKMEMNSSVLTAGFVALTNAAGQGGLTRIIPMNNHPENIRAPIEYATPLVKGPMDIKMLLFNEASGSTTGTVDLILDYVKRKV